MKFFVAAFFSFFIGLYGFAQDLNALIQEADRLEAIPDEKAALLKLKEALKIQPSNLYALTKASELCCRIGGREKTNPKIRDEYYAVAGYYARTALRLYPESDLANVAMALAIGRTILLKSGREKVSSVKELKDYADKAVKLNPQNFKAWHILGKWNYEVSNLNAFERAFAKILYGGIPPGSLQNSIACYEKAKSLNPSFALNYLELSKAYHRNGQDRKALEQLHYLLTLKNQTEDDPRIKTEAQALIKLLE